MRRLSSVGAPGSTLATSLYERPSGYTGTNSIGGPAGQARPRPSTAPCGTVRAVTSEWCTVVMLPGRSSTASMNLSSLKGFGDHTVNTGIVPSAGTSIADGISRIASGGRPLTVRQPSTNGGSGGSDPAPFGA